MPQGPAGVTFSRRQRGCAGGGLPPRLLCAPVSQGLARVALSRRQKRGARGVVSDRGFCTRQCRRA
eukprot:6994372-Pyramimonas_sp.AAC.1